MKHFNSVANKDWRYMDVGQDHLPRSTVPHHLLCLAGETVLGMWQWLSKTNSTCGILETCTMRLYLFCWYCLVPMRTNSKKSNGFSSVPHPIPRTQAPSFAAPLKSTPKMAFLRGNPRSRLTPPCNNSLYMPTGCSKIPGLGGTLVKIENPEDLKGFLLSSNLG